VVLPGAAADDPAAWLGDGTSFSLIGRTGEGPAAVAVYARMAPAGAR
jgi:hypothetical protein